MSEKITNPYAPPTALPGVEKDHRPRRDELARRFTRFAASMVDGIIMLAILMPIQFATGYFERAMNQQVGMIEQLVMSLGGMIVMLILNGYLLFARGQTIGKLLTKIKIVEFESGNLLPFLKVYVFRYLWTLPIIIVIIIIPGIIDDMLLNIFVLIDALMIFGPRRRCLHDFLAGSKVVLYQPNRQRG